MDRESQLSARIDEVKAELVALGDLRPGSLSTQYNTCSHPRCRCKDPAERHGPYFQLSYSHKGRSTSENVRPADLDQVRAQLDNYKKFRELIEDGVDAAIELGRLRLPARPDDLACGCSTAPRRSIPVAKRRC